MQGIISQEGISVKQAGFLRVAYTEKQRFLNHRGHREKQRTAEGF